MSDDPQHEASGHVDGREASAAARARSRPARRGHRTTWGVRATQAAHDAPADHWMTSQGAHDAPSNLRGSKPTGLRRLLPTRRMVLGGLLLFLLAGLGALAAGYVLVDIPQAKATAIAQSNVYLYSDGTQLARDGEVNRENVTLSQIPRHTQRAVLAAEDRDFYSESAISAKAMARATWNMLQGGGRQSGSTITQQYVKNYYLNQEQTLTRKAKEFFIAIKLDREVSKDDILLGYLNTSYFGRNAYGIQTAAHAYYGKSAADLTVAESAYLAALLNSPGAYDSQESPSTRARAVARWNYVLDGMVEEGWLSLAARDRMTFPEPDPVKPATGMAGQRGYLVEAVKQYLIDKAIVDEQQLATGGFRITTTIDRNKQDALVEAVDEQLMSELSDDREVDSYVRVGGTSIDPATGKVVALYGGVDYTQQYVNNATRRDYQVASTFKPVVLTAATEHDSTTQDGRPITPNTVYDGTNKREVIGPDGPTGFAPSNEDDRSYGKLTVSAAMDKSVNAVFAQMGADVGAERIKDTAVRLGIPADTPGLTESQGSLALGTATASTLDMAQAYATLANHGMRTPRSLVQEITRGGRPIELPDQDTEQAVSQESADTTTRVLINVVEDGTGVAAQSAGRPAAGKTGTAEEDKAAWFAGYTPDLATVVSVMGQDPETGKQQPLYGALGEERISGGGYPARIWGAYTAAALEGQPVQDFDLEVGGDWPVQPVGPTQPVETTPVPTGSPVTDQSPTTSAPPESSAPPSPSLTEPTLTGEPQPSVVLPTLLPEPGGGTDSDTDGNTDEGIDGGTGADVGSGDAGEGDTGEGDVHPVVGAVRTQPD